MSTLKTSAKRSPLKSTPMSVLKARKLRLVTAEDVLKTCRVAAAIALKGEEYGTEDRADATAALVLLVMERAKDDPEAAHYADLFPARLIGMDFLVNRAANERRTLKRRNEVEGDSTDASAEDAGNEDAPKPRKLHTHGASAGLNEHPVNDGTPVGARRAALDMLANAGLWDGSRSGKLAPNVHANVDAVEYPQGALFDERRDASTVRAAAPEGPLWTLAYGVARATAAGLDSREIASELELSFATYRKHLSRAATLLAREGIAPGEWFKALHAEDAPHEASGGYLKRDERASQRDFKDAPVSTSRVARRTTDHGSAWSAVRTVSNGGGRTFRLDPITPLQRKANEKRTAQRRTRLASLTAAQRSSARRSAGLPDAPK